MPTAKKLKASKSKRTLHLVDNHLEIPVQDESQYQILFENASDAIVSVDQQGKIIDVNLAFQELTGFLKQELKNKEISMLIPDPQFHHIPNRMKPLDLNSLKHSGTFEDIAILRKDHYVRLVELSIRVVGEEKNPLSIVLIRDVTEKKAMERELITKHAELKNAYFRLEKINAELKGTQDSLVQAGKMAALGELATGIAHELNQPLQGIRGYAQELQAVLSPLPQYDGEISYFLKEIVSNSDKMASIIQHLRVFTRKSVEKHEKTDVHEAIDEALKMMERQFFSRGIKVKKNYGKIATVYANPLQLEQVFINLSANARDAMESSLQESGCIEISTQMSGDFVEVRFKDNGCGMNERTQSKLFNPFFTTKDVGKGMGLGMSISYGILNKINGSIVVESAVGKGTEFIIKIPIDFREMA